MRNKGRIFKTTKHGVTLLVDYFYDKVHEEVVIESICAEDSDIDIYPLLGEMLVEQITEEAIINFENEY